MFKLFQLFILSDLSHLETRMSVFLDGFEFHVYNKSQVYGRLEKLFKGENIEIIDETPPEINVTKKRCS